MRYSVRMKRQKAWSFFSRRLNRYVATLWARYDFGNYITVKRGNRKWKAVIVEACLDHDMNFVHWRVKVINWRLWYRMFPSDKCTHYVNVDDPNINLDTLAKCSSIGV